jgi:hypothetical protein
VYSTVSNRPYRQLKAGQMNMSDLIAAAPWIVVGVVLVAVCLWPRR